MKRHRQRDLEAGGPGCGNLDTRKRAWKASDGTVVEKRSRVQEVEIATARDFYETHSSAPIVSPPLSDQGRLDLDFHPGVQDEHPPTVYADLEARSAIPQGVAPRYAPRQVLEEYVQPAISVLRTRTPPNYGQPEYPSALQPDTASSFNMPYTTALDYNWLFDLELATASGFGLTGLPTSDLGPIEQVERSEDVTMTEQLVQNPTPDTRTLNKMPSSALDVFDDGRQRQEESTASLPASLGGNNLRERHPNSKMRTRSAALKTARPQFQGPRSHVGINDDVRIPLNDYNGASQCGVWSSQRLSQSEKPLSMLQNPDFLPQISEMAREKLLVTIETANPNIPHQSVDSSIRHHPMLNRESLQSWLDLFFLQFNTAYPLIHVPTFNASETEPLLLLSIVLLGATYGDKSAHQLAVCIHDVIRPLIFAHAGFSPRPELWTLQTILLVECFGKSRAGQKQHDYSHLFHGLLINLIRRSDCQSINTPPQPPPEEADAMLLDKAWRQWAEFEQKKRLALLCFMWDTQHAVLFCQSLCMSAFELRCAMPCTQRLWESFNAGSWATECRRSQSQLSPPSAAAPTFLSTLKAYLSATTALRHGIELDALSLILVLHGIMSIAWDMQRRDQTSLGVNLIIGTASWRDLLGKAYDRWKADFDKYSEHAAAYGNIQLTLEWKAFAAAYKAVYHAAQALLHMDFLDLQIYAGARHILGRPVQQPDYVRASRIVKRWAAKDRERAAVAAWHSASILYEVLALKQDEDSPNDRHQNFATTYASLFHVPWCLYLATLTVWAFHYAKPSYQAREAAVGIYLGDDVDSPGDDHDSIDEIVWDAKKEMEALIREMISWNGERDTIQDMLSIQGRKGTHGLIWVVADLLSVVRWGLVHAGVSVLRGLVPTRLINQYEDVSIK